MGTLRPVAPLPPTVRLVQVQVDSNFTQEIACAAQELSARFSHVDLSEAPGAFGGDAGEMDIWSAGLTWLLNPYLNVFFNYRYITLNRSGEEGTSHGFNTRVMIVLE